MLASVRKAKVTIYGRPDTSVFRARERDYNRVRYIRPRSSLYRFLIAFGKREISLEASSLLLEENKPSRV